MALVVEVRGITKSFGVPVVDGVSLAVQAGAALGVVGPNGAGKTTLLNLIAGDLRPDSGAVLLNGADVTSVPSNRRCRDGLARTSQVPRPFEGMTVLENALVGATYGRPELRKPSQRVEAAAEALRRTGMLAKANQAAGSLALLDRKRLELSGPWPPTRTSCCSTRSPAGSPRAKCESSWTWSSPSTPTG